MIWLKWIGLMIVVLFFLFTLGGVILILYFTFFVPEHPPEGCRCKDCLDRRFGESIS